MSISDCLKHIRNGYIAVLISVGFTLLAYIFQIDAEDVNLFSDPLIFIDVVLALLLAFGIYKKSRVCAIIMLAYYIISKIVYYYELSYYGIDFPISSSVIIIVFIYFFFQAVRGTISFHKLKKQNT